MSSCEKCWLEESSVKSIIAYIENEKPKPLSDNRVECIQCGGTGFEDMGDIQIGCINCNGTGKVARREE